MKRFLTKAMVSAEKTTSPEAGHEVHDMPCKTSYVSFLMPLLGVHSDHLGLSSPDLRDIENEQHPLQPLHEKQLLGLFHL